MEAQGGLAVRRAEAKEHSYGERRSISSKIPAGMAMRRAGAGRAGKLCAVLSIAIFGLHGPASADGALVGTLRPGGRVLPGITTEATRVSVSSLALRLKGGRGCTGTRGSCRQRKYHIRKGVHQDAKRNRPIALSHKPCTGSWALSKVERFHGAAVIQSVLWQASPRSPFHDPRTAALRHGLRWNKYETNTGFKMVHKDLNHALLKACFRGMSALVPGLVEHGAEINFQGQAKTGLSAELVGLTPISAAAHQGWPTVVQMLLDMGADHRGGVLDDPRYDQDGKVLWVTLAKANAAKRAKTKADMAAKIAPYNSNGRRTPGVRRTRTAHGSVRPKR